MDDDARIVLFLVIGAVICIFLITDCAKHTGSMDPYQYKMEEPK